MTEASDGTDGSADAAESDEPTRLARVRGIFLGGKLRILGTVLLSLILLVVLGFVLGIFGVPSVEGVDNGFGAVNESTTTIETDLRVDNPNPIGLKLGGSTLEYSVAMNEIRMAEGTNEGLGVGPGNSTLNFTSYMNNSKIPEWWVSHVGDEVSEREHTTVEVVATVRSSLLPFTVAPDPDERTVDTDITAAFNSTEQRKINASQPLVSDPVLYLNETSGTWGEVTAEETDVDMGFTLYNPKPYAISASRIGYDMTMNGIAVGDGETSGSVLIPPGETREITATTTIVNGRLDEWWVSHLERNQRTNLSIDFHAQIGSQDGTFDPIRIPLDTMSETIETDIFRNKDTADGANGDGTDQGTDAEDGTDGDTGTTPTDGTDDGSTDTPTDDGGLVGDDGTTGDDSTDDTTTDGDEATPTDTPTDGGLLG